MKTILVPTDFSKNSFNAIDYAMALAKKEKAKIILFHAYHHISYIEPGFIGQPMSKKIDVEGEKMNELLQLLCQKIIKSKKVKCEYISKYDLVVNAILNTIEQIKPDWVVMGTKGASGIKGMIMGSNTAKVIEKAKCPVFAIPENASFKQIKKITYVTNYIESDISAMKTLVEIAQPFNARINALHASDEEFTPYSEKIYLQAFKSKVKKKIKYDRISFTLAYGKYLTKVLDKHIKQDSPDLIAMSTRYRNFWEKLFGASVTKEMAYHTTVPLIAFHHNEEVKMFF